MTEIFPITLSNLHHAFYTSPFNEACNAISTVVIASNRLIIHTYYFSVTYIARDVWPKLLILKTNSSLCMKIALFSVCFVSYRVTLAKKIFVCDNKTADGEK